MPLSSRGVLLQSLEVLPKAELQRSGESSPLSCQGEVFNSMAEKLGNEISPLQNHMGRKESSEHPQQGQREALRVNLTPEGLCTQGRSCCSIPADVFVARGHGLSSSGAPDTIHDPFVYKNKHQKEQTNAILGVVSCGAPTTLAFLPCQANIYFPTSCRVMVLCTVFTPSSPLPALLCHLHKVPEVQHHCRCWGTPEQLQLTKRGPTSSL